jgi:hypothetical protein
MLHIFHKMRHPQEMGIAENREFLTFLAVVYSRVHQNGGRIIGCFHLLLIEPSRDIPRS